MFLFLTFVMKHQKMGLYKVYINPDPWTTLNLWQGHALEWGKTCRKWANGLNIYEFEKEVGPRG